MGSAAACGTSAGKCVSVEPNASIVDELMFCAATSVLMFVSTPADCPALSAVTKEKMVVNAGVVFCAEVSTVHIGWKPSATLSFASAALSQRSQSSDHTEDSLHQQPLLSLFVPGGLVDGFVSMLKML